MIEFSFTIEGVSYDSLQLIALCHRKIEEKGIGAWEQAVYCFILEWLNGEEVIHAHTSGSTGVPRRIVLKKAHMINSAQKTIDFLKLKVGDSALLCLPVNFIAGKMMVVRAFVGGLNLLVREPVGHPLNDIQGGVDFAAMIPMQLHNELCLGKRLGLVKQLIVGGGALIGGTVDALCKYPTIVYESYGMTETVSHIALRVVAIEGCQTAFSPLSNASVSLDSRGCLVIDAPDVADGMVVTNDLIDLFSDNRFVIKGRVDNVINSGGVKISPEMVEGKIRHLVEGEFVISFVPDEKLGQKVVLVLEKDTPLPDLGEIQQLLTKYECPKCILRLDVFPRTENDKIRRKELSLELVLL